MQNWHPCLVHTLKKKNPSTVPALLQNLFSLNKCRQAAYWMGLQTLLLNNLFILTQKMIKDPGRPVYSGVLFFLTGKSWPEISA